MNQGELEYLELLCKQLYEAVDPQERTVAEKAIEGFSEVPDCLQKCYLLLERGTSAYAQHVAATTLRKLLSKPSPSVSLEERIELRNYLLNYLVGRSKLPNFVVQSLCRLFARLTKLSWFDTQRKSASSVGSTPSSASSERTGMETGGNGSSEDFLFRASIDEIMKFELQGSMEMCSLAVQLLSHLVEEINQQSGISSISKHRQISASFRDTYLFNIFQLSIRLLQSACDNIKTIILEDENQKNLLTNLLQLAVNCLNFDFIGSMFDDTTDENVSVQVPTAWRVAFIDASIVKLFYSLYAVLPADLAALALSCLVQLTSVRRTIFNTNERQAFLSALVAGVKAILESPQGLADQATYHEFCRLIARLKSNYQLTELIKMDDYPKFMRMITEFTVTSLQMFRFSANSIHYLLSFWQRMVSSMPYVKMTEPHLLEQHAPIVTKGYIETRLNLPAAVIQDGIEDPLEDQSSMSQQMEQLSVICRCEYDKTCQLLIQLFDQSAAAYQQAMQQNQQLEQTLEEGRLSWCVYIIGAAIGGRVACNSSDEHELIDGDLICRVLQLIRLTDQRLPNRGAEKLEIAYLWFLEQFRKIYISDQVQKNTKVYHKLTEVLGLIDDGMVLAVFVQKIITNLKYWSTCERTVDPTLALLNDLSMGYTSVRKLARLPEVQFLLRNHTNEHFSFLGTAADLRTMKSRTTFYTALTRLLCVDLGEDEEQFEQFVAPLTSAFTELSKMCAMSESSLVNQEEAKRVIIGLARDVRGIAFACNTKGAFIMLFDWIYPNFLTVLHRAIEVWYTEPSVTTPALKLMCELCQNRSQRLQFDVSSPNAILLFKEASKWICSYGSRILTRSDIPKDQLYNMRLKGIMVCFGILRAAMCGSYVNFGVFRLYGDSCLDDAFSMFVKMVLAIPQTDLLAYSKLSQNYFALLESVAQDHMTFLSHLEPQIFIYVLQTLHEGLTALDTMVCTCCCSALDNMITYLYRRVSRSSKPPRSHAGIPPEGDNCLRVLEMQPEVMRQTLATILNVIMFDECRCQWSMSRPMLGLTLLNEDYFNQLKVQVVGSQPSDKQQRLLQCFDALMDGIERNLTVKNKDRFTQNVSLFRRQVGECLKGANVMSGPGGFDEVLFVTFNQDATSLAVGTKRGYKLFPLNQLDELKPIHEFAQDDVCLVERLYSSSLVTLVTLAAPRKLQVCHFQKGQEICSQSYSNTILAVRLNRLRLVVCLEESLYIHNIRDMKMLHTIRDTPPNPQGLCELTSSNDISYLAYPGSSTIGEVQIFDTANLQAVTMIAAHNSPLAALKFNADGRKLATASDKGTVIRVFAVPSGDKLFEFRRGMKRCVTIFSLAFSVDSLFLCSSSNTETVHVFKLEHHDKEASKSKVVAEEQAGGGVQGWVNFVSKTAASYLPSQVSEIFHQDRAFAHAKLPQAGARNVCALTVVKQQPRLLVASLDGYFYVYALDKTDGGECVLLKQHRLVSVGSNPASSSSMTPSTETASQSLAPNKPHPSPAATTAPVSIAGRPAVSQGGSSAPGSAAALSSSPSTGSTQPHQQPREKSYMMSKTYAAMVQSQAASSTEARLNRLVDDAHPELTADDLKLDDSREFPPMTHSSD